MVGVFVADIIDLNEVNENFQLELILMSTWHDPRLAFDAKKEGSGEKIFQGPYQFAEVFAGWWPQLLILNEVGRGDFNAVKITVYADGQVRYAEQRNVLGVGVETVGTDAGQASAQDPMFPCHNIMHGANKCGLAGLTNLDKLPPKGALLIAPPLKIKGGSGSPTRVLALVTS
jgi:hypothetical protein